MSPKEMLSRARKEHFTWVDYTVDGGKEIPFDMGEAEGTETKLELLPGLSASDIEKLEKSLPAPLPEEIRELLQFSAGFSMGGEEVDFTLYGDWGYDFLLPHVVILRGDGCGNSWVVEVDWNTGEWRHVWFECHDPPVLVYECETLSEFIEGVLDLHRFEKCAAGHRSILCDTFDRCMAVWKDRRGLPKAKELADTSDPVLQKFLASIDENSRVADLRELRRGGGFDWSPLNAGRRKVKREDTLPLFGIEPPRGFFGRLFW